MPRDERKVNLVVLHLYPGTVILITQSQIQSESVGRSPVVLEINAKYIGALAPSAGTVDPTAKGVRESKKEISFTGARATARHRQQVGTSGKASTEVHKSGSPVRACFIGVDALPPILEPGVEHMAAVGDD